MSSSIVWTALPTSFDSAAGLASVAVYVSPRIDDAPTVGASRFASWPTTMAAASFGIVLDAGPTWSQAAPIPATVTNSAFDASLWSAIFPANTPIKQYQFHDNSTRALWSYNVDALNQAIESVYASVAANSAKDFPTIDFSQPNLLTDWILAMDGMNKKRTSTRDQLYYNWGGTGVAVTPQPRLPWSEQTRIEMAAVGTLAQQSPVQAAAWGMKRFYDRPSNLKDGHGNLVLMGTDQNNNPVPVPIPRPNKPSFDFHERVALLADHPLLLERLGLVIRLQFRMSPDMTAPAFIRVVPSWGGPSGYDVTPRTAYERSGKRFAPRPADPVGGDHVAGLVALEDSGRFGVYQVDVDGDGHKMVNYASTIANYVQNYLVEQATQSNTQVVAPQESVPARRNAGFQLTRKDRATQLKARFTTNLALHKSFVPYAPGSAGAPPNDLYLDDVTRGYRLDVSVNGGPWQSLHQRTTHYQLGVLPAVQTEILPLKADEAYTKAASATSDPDPNGPTDMYVHEKFISWNGWSLAAPRPGQTLFNANDPHGNDVPSAQNLGANPDFPIDTHVRALPGSLPSLRYGKSYRFRARVVDLAGQSLDLNDPGATTTTHVTSAHTYQRYEPLPPPVTVLQNVVTEGESADHMVIRSDPTSPGNGNSVPAKYATYLNNTYNADLQNMSLDPSRPQYKLYAGTSERHVAPPKCTQVHAEMHGKFDAVFSSFDPAQQQKFFALGTREEGTFMDWRMADLNDPTNYLQDPNRAQIITPPQVPYNERRDPNAPLTSSSLVANRGDALAPGEYVICNVPQATLPYLPDPGVIGSVIWDPTTNADLFAPDWTVWQSNQWPDLKPYRLELAGTAASTPQATPGADVEQIALPPATIYTVRMASRPDPAQVTGNVFAYTNTYAPDASVLDGRHWMLTPYKEIKLVHAVPRPLTPPSMFLPPRREPNDTVVRFIATPVTSHSNSTGEVELVGEWDEYNDSPTLPKWTTQHQKGHAFRVEIPYGTDTFVAYAEQKHELGDTKHRVITYSTIGTTRYKEYFPAAMIADVGNITTPGTATGGDVQNKPDTFQVLIPSTARPKAPKVEYVVPTFQWQRPRAPLGSAVSVRKGGGLRIYLDRPWFSSGQDEILAVLLQPQGVAVSPTTLPFVSRWGRDPIWDSKANAPLDPTRFLNAKGPALSLLLHELPQMVTAVPFDVEFSAERGLWFCDIVMDPSDTYFPFVSLALARYQPYSLGGLELSPMVRADFAQIVPDRTVNLASRPTAVSVTVTGAIADNLLGELTEAFNPSPAPPTGRVKAPRANTFSARVEQRVAGAVGDLGWQSIAGPVQLTGSLPLNSKVGTWQGTVTIPLANGLDRRVVVEEVENIRDDSTAAATRIVYMDMMSL